MSQNVYDEPEFFSGYSRLNRSVKGLDGAPEWASLQALLPHLDGAKVLDLGCGFGWFCRWAHEHGAAQVLGLDLSEKMLERARQATVDPAITYQQADLEDVKLPAAAFDLVYSSLALHYIVNLPVLVQQIAQSLTPGGRFVFSAEHPIFTAPRQPGWVIHPQGYPTWVLDQYLLEGPRTTDWLGSRVVKQHRTIGTYLNLLIASGLTLRHVEEWQPSDEQIATFPELAEERERPMFLLAAAEKV